MAEREGFHSIGSRLYDAALQNEVEEIRRLIQEGLFLSSFSLFHFPLSRLKKRATIVLDKIKVFHSKYWVIIIV